MVSKTDRISVDTRSTYYNPYRGFTFGQSLTESLTRSITGDKAHLVAIIRAHQHNQTMPQLISTHATQNRSIYKLFPQHEVSASGTVVITTVLTAAYSPNRALITIELPSYDSATWSLTGLWQPKDYSKPWQQQQNNTFKKWQNQVE